MKRGCRLAQTRRGMLARRWPKALFAAARPIRLRRVLAREGGR